MFTKTKTQGDSSSFSRLKIPVIVNPPTAPSNLFPYLMQQKQYLKRINFLLAKIGDIKFS